MCFCVVIELICKSSEWIQISWWINNGRNSKSNKNVVDILECDELVDNVKDNVDGNHCTFINYWYDLYLATIICICVIIFSKMMAMRIRHVATPWEMLGFDGQLCGKKALCNESMSSSIYLLQYTIFIILCTITNSVYITRNLLQSTPGLRPLYIHVQSITATFSKQM